LRRYSGAVLVALIALALAATNALAHGGGSLDYISKVRSAPDGLTVEVLDRDDRLVLRNDSGRTVIVEGYNGEPYARLDADGTVEVNLNSPAHYLNDDRFADVDLPARADEKSAPAWKRVDRSGSFEWHDHRMHWMSTGRPPVVEDPGERTKVFDWDVPVRVGGSPASVTGTLTWVGRTDDSFPVAAAVALGAVVLGGIVLVVVVRRRRRSRGGGGEAEPKPQTEAW
jgi:hypothetical protein